MEETIIEVGSDEVSVEPSADGVVLGFTDYDSPIYGSGAINLPRPQLRALIEALRQADAETRTGPEIVVRMKGGISYAYGLLPGSVDEWDLGSTIPGMRTSRVPLTRDDVHAWAKDLPDEHPWRGATIYLSGFPDEPTE